MNDGDHGSHPLTLADYVAVLRRRKWLIVQAVVIAPIIAVLVALQDPTYYRASAEVLLNRQNLGGQLIGIQDPTIFQDPVRQAQTQADLASVPEVAVRTAKIANLPGITPAVAQGSTSVTARTDADLLVFSAISREPTIAPVLATAYAKAFTEYRKDLDTAAIKNAQQELSTRLDELKKEGRQDSALYASLVEKDQQLRTLQLLQASNILVRPAVGAAKVGPAVRRNAVLGLAFGLVIGIALAFLREALDRRVRSAGDVEKALHLPLLGRLPEPPRRFRRARHLAMIEDPRGTYAEVFRTLRTNVEFANVELGAKTIMVTSAVAQEGKSTTVANLAVALARAGRSVTLVDLDFRQPTVAEFFGIEKRWGMAEVVRGRAQLDDVVVSVAFPGRAWDASSNGDAEPGSSLLEVVPAGLILPSDPGEFVYGRTLDEILAKLRERTDFVLIDAPPLLAVGDAMALAPRVDALLVVTRLAWIRRPALHELARVLRATPTPKIGFVLTGSPLEDSYGYGAYGYFDAAEGQRRRTRAR